jgi:quinol-cytochrome oxidoreductase complex cytochrome b subunit
MFAKEKGVGGLNILLGVVVSIFVLGLIVMIFALMGANLMSATTDAGAKQVINDTSTSISGVTDWFPIIITIAVLVVLILFTVLIITAIRGSGMISSDASA